MYHKFKSRIHGHNVNFSSDEFIQRLKNKDKESLSILVDTYHEALFKGALKQGLASDQAEEAVQATWFTFLDAVQNFEGRSHIRSYIFGILYNKIKEMWRSNKKYTTHFDDSFIEKCFDDNGNYLTPPVDPASWLQSEELSHIVSQELEHLPFKQRMAFQLKEIEGLDTEEICKIIEVSITNLGVLIYRAKQNLRLRVEKIFNEKGYNE